MIAATTSAVAVAVTLAVTASMASACPARATASIRALAVRAVELTYSVHLRGDVNANLQRFARMVDATLHHPRGWSLQGKIDFRRVSSGGDMRLILASPAAVEEASPGCSPHWSCRVGHQVLINERRWDDATSSWTGSLRGYRHYVVNHEVGHFLGLGHRHCEDPGGPAPVMQQQSIDLEGCTHNVWPYLSELQAAARHQGVAVPKRSPLSRDEQQETAERGHDRPPRETKKPAPTPSETKPDPPTTPSPSKTRRAPTPASVTATPPPVVDAATRAHQPDHAARCFGGDLLRFLAKIPEAVS